MSTATTTLTRTNWAIRTNTTKNRGATYWLTQQLRRQSSDSSHSSLRVSFIIPFQLSPLALKLKRGQVTINIFVQPVAILNKVRKAMPKDLKWACSPRPWQGYSSSHSAMQCNQCKMYHELALSTLNQARDYMYADAVSVILNTYLCKVCLNHQIMTFTKILSVFICMTTFLWQIFNALSKFH